MEDEDHELEVATYQHRRRRSLNERRYAGSIPGRVRIHRDHISGDARIRADYFCAQPVTRMHNFGGGFACVAMCSSASFLLCNKWIRTSFNVQTVPRSNLFDSHLNGDSPPVSFSVNGHTYNMGYYLADESARKDIERTFGVLQKRWAIVRGPAYGWSPQHIGDIMKTCIILHNMIVEDEGPSSLNTSFDNIGVLADTSHGSISERNEYINNRYDQLHDPVKYNQLLVDLIHHHWARLGSGAA
eukprot:XP_020393775.1 uncharacterized protein LOC109939831 [Zea mays]